MGVEGQLWRALAVFRVLALLYDGARLAMHAGAVGRTVWLWTVILLAAAWTTAVLLLDRDPARRRSPWVRGVDLMMTCVVVALSLAAYEPTVTDDYVVPALWATGAVVAIGLGRGWGSAVVAALAIGVVQVLLVGHLNTSIVNGVVVMGVAGGLLGWIDHLARQAELRTSRAAAAEAQQRERERLSRAVHDGVLQVLGLVQHRAPELGPEGVELGRLAGEQEAALRALIARNPAPAGGQPLGSTGQVDLGEALTVLGSARVSVAVPADAVPWPADQARELVAAVAAALDNVARHAGVEARAWLLLEEDDDGVIVTVRDDGVGMEADRPAAAVREGRLGISRSIIQRVLALGGTAEVTGLPGRGVEVEIRVPRNENRSST